MTAHDIVVETRRETLSHAGMMLRLKALRLKSVGQCDAAEAIEEAADWVERMDTSRAIDADKVGQ